MIEVRGLSKIYRRGKEELKVLNQVSFEVREGTSIAIVGPSGSGKTTLLSLLCGLDDADEGQIAIADQDIVPMTESQRSLFRAHHIGIVFQKFHLIHSLTALENVRLPLDMLAVADAEDKARQALIQVGLEERADHLPAQLSGGESQRVAIARALIAQPKVIFADEPSGNLDARTGELIMDLLFELVEQKHSTLVLVTHNQEHASRCQGTLKLQDAQLCLQ